MRALLFIFVVGLAVLILLLKITGSRPEMKVKSPSPSLTRLLQSDDPLDWLRLSKKEELSSAMINGILDNLIKNNFCHTLASREKMLLGAEIIKYLGRQKCLTANIVLDFAKRCQSDKMLIPFANYAPAAAEKEVCLYIMDRLTGRRHFGDWFNSALSGAIFTYKLNMIISRIWASTDFTPLKSFSDNFTRGSIFAS